MKRELICISCPVGCRLDVMLESGRVEDVSGGGCPRGAQYARQECVAPMRVFTGIMKARGCAAPFSVRTDRPVPKEMLLPIAAELKRHHPPLPVLEGEIVLENILNTGSSIIATQKLDKKRDFGV